MPFWVVMNVNIIVLNIIFSIYSKFSVKYEIFSFLSSGTHSGTQYGAHSVTDRICLIRSNLVEFVHAVVSLAPRRSRTVGARWLPSPRLNAFFLPLSTYLQRLRKEEHDNDL